MHVQLSVNYAYQVYTIQILEVQYSTVEEKYFVRASGRDEDNNNRLRFKSIQYNGPFPYRELGY